MSEKTVVTERECVYSVIDTIFKVTADIWPSIIEGFEKTFHHDDSNWLPLSITKGNDWKDFILAYIACESAAISNLFAPEQAKRLLALTKDCLEIDFGLTEESGMLDSMLDPDKINLMQFTLSQTKHQPGYISYWLTERWYENGHMICKSTLKNGDTVVSPLVHQYIIHLITNISGKWKFCIDNFELIEGLFPIEWELNKSNYPNLSKLHTFQIELATLSIIKRGGAKTVNQALANLEMIHAHSAKRTT